MYTVFLDGVALPIAPSKIETKITNKNKTINLINDGEVNILKAPGLTEISFQVMLPQALYPFAIYPDGFKKADYYLNILERLKTSKEPFQFICSRVSQKGLLLFDTDIKVSLEDYKVVEDAKNGIDLMVSIKLKQYRSYGVSVLVVEEKLYASKARVINTRTEEKSPAPKKTPKTHVVGPGDTLWGLAKKYYGNGSKYPKIFNANRDKLSNPNLIIDGQALVIPV